MWARVGGEMGEGGRGRGMGWGRGGGGNGGGTAEPCEHFKNENTR